MVWNRIAPMLIAAALASCTTATQDTSSLTVLKRDAANAYETGDYGRAATLWQEVSAKFGDAEAQYNLGNVFASGGKGLASNLAKAREYWSYSASQHYLPSAMAIATAKVYASFGYARDLPGAYLLLQPYAGAGVEALRLRISNMVSPAEIEARAHCVPCAATIRYGRNTVSAHRKHRRHFDDAA